jgi:hypothetical protein
MTDRPRNGLVALCLGIALLAAVAAAAICAMLLSAWSFEGRLEVPPLVVFGAIAAASAWLVVRMYRSMEPVGE